MNKILTMLEASRPKQKVNIRGSLIEGKQYAVVKNGNVSYVEFRKKPSQRQMIDFNRWIKEGVLWSL